jgi:pyridoxal phosphate enzyme (YggS family)
MASGALDILSRFAEVRARIAGAEGAAGRAPGSVRLVAVAKTVPAEGILPLLEAGQRDFGENRVQEAEAKWPGLKARYPDIRLHLIGPLQSNKIREAVALFDAIHTVDREKIAVALAAEIARQGRVLELLAQVNTGAEPQKAGVIPEEVVALASRWRDDLKLSLTGLMCIPPLGDLGAPHFALLAKLARRLDFSVLSMGMSGDFEKAIAFGATYVRVGTAIFGQRTKI